jgi:Ca2+-binding EF-hand superfamily protein
MTIDIGNLTTKETKQMMQQCIDYLTLEQLIEVLNENLSQDQKDEIIEHWQVEG